LIVNPGTPQERSLETKVTTTLQPGDVLRHTQAGGGGWGDPREREAAGVMRDVLNEKVSIEKARELYGVVIDRDSMRVNIAATLACRQKPDASRRADRHGACGEVQCLNK
jgi:N-methylhydantoinase B